MKLVKNQPPDDSPTLRPVIGYTVPDDPRSADRVRKLIEQRYAGTVEADVSRMRAARAEKRAACLAWALGLTWALIAAGFLGWRFGA